MSSGHVAHTVDVYCGPVLRHPAERPTACFCSPLSARCRAMRFHVRGVDHLCVCGSSVSSKLPEQVFPDATPRPAHKAIIDAYPQKRPGHHLQYRISALGQMASGSIDVAEDYVRLEVFLPWLLAKLAETLQPLIRKEGTLLLEKK